MFRSARHLAAAVIGSALALPSTAHAQFGSNLLTNPGAEAGAASVDGNGVVPPPGWVTTGNLTVVAYGTAGGFPTAASPGSPTRGFNFFAGGQNETFSTATQNIFFLATMWSSIDAGTAQYTLGGWLGGFETQFDYASLSVSFFDASDNLLASNSVVGPDTDRGGITGMLFREVSDVPVATGARRAEVQLSMTRSFGTYDDGYADDLSFVVHGAPPVTGAPEPSSIVLAATGLFTVGGLVRRRKAHATPRND